MLGKHIVRKIDNKNIMERSLNGSIYGPNDRASLPIKESVRRGTKLNILLAATFIFI